MVLAALLFTATDWLDGSAGAFVRDGGRQLQCSSVRREVCRHRQLGGDLRMNVLARCMWGTTSERRQRDWPLQPTGWPAEEECLKSCERAPR